MIALLYLQRDGSHKVRSLHMSLHNAQSAVGRAVCNHETQPIVVELLTIRHKGDIVPINEFVLLPKSSSRILAQSRA